MRIRISENGITDTEKIIGVFDADTATVSAVTKDFIKRAQNAGKLTDADGELPKSFVITSDGSVLFSKLAASPQTKRCVKAGHFTI